VTRVQVSYADEAISALDDSWDELVRAQERPNPTLLAGWLAAMVERERGRLVVLRGFDAQGRLLAAAMISVTRPLGRAGPSIARWPGDPRLWFDSDILVRPEVPHAGVALVDALVREVHALHVPCLAGSALDLALRRGNRYAVHRWKPVDGWTSPIPVPRDAYTRARIAKDIRAAARKQAVITTTHATSATEVSEALERLFRLHRAFSSVHPGAVARFSANAESQSVFRTAVGALAGSGDAYITEIREDGEVTASGLALRAGAGLVFHTMATKRQTRLREPGHACTLATMDLAARLGCTHVDLGPGAGEPGSLKHRIGAHRVPLPRTLCARSTRSLLLCRALLAVRDRARHEALRVRGWRNRP
jgi:CelD/BcsL family acetyltransferase involved in cellulose biosynthesis